jgi:hypothetical protein
VPSAGDKLGPYELLSPLGAGGMGEVYRARDARLGREVAIKTSKEEFSGRFQREARAISALNHANILLVPSGSRDMLVVSGAPVPSNMISPTSGATLTGDTATFNWDAGSQVVQNQLSASTMDESNNTVACPHSYTGTGRTASVDLGVCCVKRRTLTATLGSTFVSNALQSQAYRYTCGPNVLSPAGVSVSPSTGTASAQSFTAVYYDVNGGSDISQVRFMIQPNATSGAANQCIMRYDRGPNNLYLLADDGVTYLGPIAGGGYDTLANSQCAITGGYSVQVEPSTLVVDFSIVFSTSFAGAKQLLLSVMDNAGNAGDVIAAGSWTVPAGSGSGGANPTPATPSDPVFPTPTPTAPVPVTKSVQNCSDITGTWSDPNIRVGSTTSTWKLVQSGNIVRGTLDVISPSCGGSYAQMTNVNGLASGGVVHLDATGPNPPSVTCGGVTNNFPTKISVDVAVTCPVAVSGNYNFIYPPLPRSPDALVNPNAPALSWTRRTFPPGLDLTFDLAAGTASVTLKNPKSGTLSITLLSATHPEWQNTSDPAKGYIAHVLNASTDNDGSLTFIYTYPFDRTYLLPQVPWTSVVANWGNDPSASDFLSVSIPLKFTTVGYTRFTRYNTTTESKCLRGHPATAYVFTGSNCQVDTYQLNSLFIQQASLNGTGRSASVPGLLHTLD